MGCTFGAEELHEIAEVSPNRLGDAILTADINQREELLRHRYNRLNPPHPSAGCLVVPQLGRAVNIASADKRRDRGVMIPSC